jgi:hypothetical protein
VNLSVWASLDELAAFVYDGPHRSFLRGRRQWFQRPAEAIAVLWWIPEGTLPTVAGALDRLSRLRRDGPGPAAFTFRHPFPAPGDRAAPRRDERWGCDVPG